VVAEGNVMAATDVAPVMRKSRLVTLTSSGSLMRRH